MKSELYKRINTGLFLFLLLIMMFISKIIYLFASICIFSLAFIEFSKISKLYFKKKYLKQLISNILFVIYLFIFLLIFIFGLNDIHFKIILFIILLICISSDIGGILFGKIFKGPKLGFISPNKTYSGVVGSFIMSFISALIFVKYFEIVFIFNTDNLFLFLIILFISLISQLGDLIISFFKRKAKLKDTGKILPGHGGLLDRIDGWIFVMPVIYFLLLLKLLSPWFFTELEGNLSFFFEEVFFLKK